ncbi:DgyrCDS9806 [Dimorphilus gyrociliatus]|uniref:DgyrCDS9806 n=1 Tax=Dimorphilus gyrociliatus TaxID=2664684 RepID=A0A7I8VYF3_9ANNE|nr:DgyrCDS9806 [Dimorphilus gyrociliatus]
MTSAVILLCLLLTGVNCRETYTAILGAELILEPPKDLYHQNFVVWHERGEVKSVLFIVRNGGITNGPQIDDRITLSISSQKVTLSLKSIKESDTGLYRFELLSEPDKRIEFYVKVQHSTASPTLPRTERLTRTTKGNQYFPSTTLSTPPSNPESPKFSDEIQLTLIICLTVIVVTIAVVVTVVCVYKMKGKDKKDLESNCPSQPPSHPSPHSEYYASTSTKCSSCSTYTSRSATPHSSPQQAQDANSFTSCSRIQPDYPIPFHGGNSSKIPIPEVFKSSSSNGFQPITAPSNQSPHSHV